MQLCGTCLDLPTLDSLTSTRSREDRIATATFNLYIAGLYSNHTLLMRGVACKIEIMNNDRRPAWKMKKVLTLNCEFSLCGLNQTLRYMGLNPECPEFGEKKQILVLHGRTQ